MSEDYFKGLAAVGMANFDAGQKSMEAELTQVRADAASVVRAFDAAIQLNGALMAYLPAGEALHPGIATAKAVLDKAIANMHRPTAPDPVGFADMLATIDRLREHNNRLNATRIAAMATLDAAMELIDAMLNEVARLPDLPMQIVVAKENLDKAMKNLRGMT